MNLLSGEPEDETMLRQHKQFVKATPISEMTHKEAKRGSAAFFAHNNELLKKYNHKEMARMIESGECRIVGWDMGLTPEE